MFSAAGVMRTLALIGPSRFRSTSDSPLAMANRFGSAPAFTALARAAAMRSSVSIAWSTSTAKRAPLTVSVQSSRLSALPARVTLTTCAELSGVLASPGGSIARRPRSAAPSRLTRIRVRPSFVALMLAGPLVSICWASAAATLAWVSDALTV